MTTPSIQATEELGARGATHPRVSVDDIKSRIAAEYYFTAGQALGNVPLPPNANLNILTICLLVVDNGFVVLGKSAPASPENFDAEKGCLFAYEDAFRQLWPLEGYALRDRLAAANKE